VLYRVILSVIQIECYTEIMLSVVERSILRVLLTVILNVVLQLLRIFCITSLSSQGQRQIAVSSTVMLPNPTTRRVTLRPGGN